MAFSPKDDNIGDLERDLYSRDAPPITANKRPSLSPHDKLKGYGWKTEDKEFVEGAAEVQNSPKKMSMATKFFVASALFFLVAALIAAFVILGGFNIISSKNVDISIQGPIAVSAGEEISLDIIIKNNNNTPLNSGTIYVEYPEGARSTSDITKDLVRDQLDLGSVPAGGSTTKTVKVVLFGEKDSIKQIKVSVDYKANTSNATFSKEKTFDITIKSSPIIMTVDVPREVNSGQDIAIKIEIASNSTTIVRDLLVRAEYPFGFNFTSGSPSPTFDKNVWRIGDLSPNEKRNITINGRMDGQNEEERTFRFLTGTGSATDERQIAVGFITAQQSLFIKKPFISLALELNNDPDEYVASVGERIPGKLSWKNNIPIAINDASIQIKLSGSGLDRSKVAAGAGGFYRSSDNTLIWDKNSMPALANIEPGEGGSINFTLPIFQNTQQLLTQGRNIDVTLDATMKGTRVQGGVPQEIKSTASSRAKVATTLIAGTQALYSTGPFSNSGSLPPRADHKTTYTIVWNLSNSFNDVSNASVKTVLPQYVRWLGRVSPTSQTVDYDESTRTVAWNIPDLRAGVGYTSASKEVAFQVELEPSLSQIGSAVDLTGQIRIAGRDRFTDTTIESTKPALTTRLSTDPAFRTGDDKVVR